MNKIEINKSRLKDKMGRPLTQGLFLEIGYNTDHAVYTLEDEHKTYKNNFYPSLKQLYLDEEDVIEYDFARKYLLGWRHWQRLNDNKVLSRHFEGWREELELMVKSAAVKGIIDQATSDSNSFQANKWLADKGWIKRQAGRPSKEELDKHKRQQELISEEYDEDINRLNLKVVEGG